MSRLTGFGGRLLRLAGLMLLAGAALALVLVVDVSLFLHTPVSLPEKGMSYTVNRGASLSTVAQDLAQRGVLMQPRYLVWTARLQGTATRIHAGEYQLSPGLTPLTLLERMVQGDVVQHNVTLVEGWTFRQVMQAIADSPCLEQTLGGLDDAAIMARLGYAGEHPEGRFFPDTYRVTRGTSDVVLLGRAYRAMQQRLEAAWAQRAPGLPYASSYEALILASIVEKEAMRTEERPLIAGVFVRRLQRGMPLGADPTVIYGLGMDFDGNIRRSDLERDGHYNTYVRLGLPPTPIAMPGAASIQAALQPADGDALYFVARGDGSHEFSATLSEHNRAVMQYQLSRQPDS